MEAKSDHKNPNGIIKILINQLEIKTKIKEQTTIGNTQYPKMHKLWKKDKLLPNN